MTNSNSWYRKEYLLGLGGLGGGAGGILIAGGPIATSGGDDAYQISKSLRLSSADTTDLRATPPHKGNQRIYTWSSWVKLASVGGGKNIFTVSASPGGSGSVARTEFAINGSGKLVFGVNSAGSSWKSVETTAALKDPAAWYHICVAVNTTNSVEAERVKIYVNGKVQVLVNNYPTQNEATPYNAAGYGHGIGTYINNLNDYFDGLIADAYMIDGLALSPAAFGSFSSSTSVFNPTVFTLPTPNDGTTWSSGGTTVGNWNEPSYGVGEIFDGNVLGTPGGACNDSSNWNGARYTLPSTVTVKSQVRVFTNGTDTRWGFDIGNGFESADSNSLTPVGSAAPYSWTLPRTTEFKGISCSDAQQIFGIEVDGVILKDGQTDLTTRNNPNNGTTWSGGTVSGATYSGYPWTNCFDGSLSTGTSGDSGVTSTLTLPTAQTGLIEVWLQNNTVDIQINGSTQDTAGAVTDSSGAKKLSLGEITLTSIGVGDGNELRGISVDGHILIDLSVDNSFNLKFNDTARNTNLGKDSLNGALADATGALPIYNTTDDYGDVKGSGNRTDSDAANLKLAIAGDAFTDSSGNSVNVAATNATISTTESRFYGSSINFDVSATNQHVTTAGNLWSANGDQTFEAWLWVNDFNQQRTIFHTSDNYYGDFSIHSTGAIRIHTNANNYQDTSNKLALKQWHHVALVQGSNFRKVYVNGIEWGFDSPTGSPQTQAWHNHAGTIEIGDDGQRYFFSGYMQDIRIYDKKKYTANFSPPTRNDFTLTNLYGGTANSNDTNVWSKVLTSTNGWWPAYGPTNGFNGSLTGGNYVEGGANAVLTFTPSGGITFTDKVEVMSKDGALTSYNGGGTISMSNNTWVEVATGGGTLNTLTFTRANSTGGQLQGVRVDGEVLIDATYLDSSTVSPTNYLPTDGVDGNGGVSRGNYCTWNPLCQYGTTTLSDGNLKAVTTTNSQIDGTFMMPYGKWYFEWNVNTNAVMQIGIVDTQGLKSAAAPGGASKNGIIYLTTTVANDTNTGKLYNNGTEIITGWPSTTTDSLVMVAYDADTGKLWFGKDGTWYNDPSSNTGNPATGANPAITVSSTYRNRMVPVCGAGGGSDAANGYANFGQNAYKYTAPDGFKTLCTLNLSDTFGANDNELEDKNDPSKYFDIKLWEGDGTTSHTIKGYNFQPDLLWIKDMDASQGQMITDAVRGATKVIFTHQDVVEATEAQSVKAFTSDGFELGSWANNNTDNETYVGWAWDAGTSAATPSTEGSITPSGQWVNDTAGFSISKYTGTEAAATVGHGLSKAPELVIVKNLGAGSSNWLFWHNEMAATEQLYTNSTDGVATGQTNTWNSAKPTSTVISMNASWWSNDSGVEHIAYCFTSIAGYSAFGAYTGNGSTDGTFVHTGFTPRYLIIKRTTGPSDWIQLDTERRDYNTNNQTLFPNKHDATAAQQDTDFLSNGFKLRNTSGGSNTSGGTYYYMAFAEHPYKTARAR